MAAKRTQFSKYLRFSTVGLELGFAVLLGLFFGQFLDGYFGSEPWLMLLFLLFGAAAGFRSLYRLLKEASADAGREQTQQEDSPP